MKAWSQVLESVDSTKVATTQTRVRTYKMRGKDAATLLYLYTAGILILEQD